MTNLKSITVSLLLLIFISAFSFSQSSLSAHLGPSFPLDKFASDNMDDNKAGSAAIGFNLGLQYLYNFEKNGLGLFIGLDFNYNGLKKDVRDSFEKDFEDMGIYNAEFKYYKYLNIPVSAGLHYTFQADKKIALLANLGLAANFMKITDMTVKVGNITTTMKFDLATSIGFKTGAGILINKKTSITANYLYLGKHDVNATIKSNLPNEKIDGEQKVDLLTLTLGFMF